MNCSNKLEYTFYNARPFCRAGTFRKDNIMHVYYHETFTLKTIQRLPL